MCIFINLNLIKRINIQLRFLCFWVVFLCFRKAILLRVKICLNPFLCVKFLFLIHVSVQDKKADVFFPAVYILAWVLERSLRSGRGMTSIARKEKTRFTEVSKQSLGKPQCLFN